jgi:phosphate transport system protein
MKIEVLKSFIVKMWSISIEQIERSKIATLEYDKNIIMEVFSNEKRIDSFELKIDMDIEEILKSTDVDVKNVLSILKINCFFFLPTRKDIGIAMICWTGSL